MPRKKRVLIDVYDRAIIQILYRSRIELNANEVARALRVEWITAEKHLRKLHRLGYATYRTVKGRRLWRLK